MRVVEDFWRLTTKPATADTRLASVPVVVISRPTLRRLFRTIRDALGPDAAGLLYRCGIESGQSFVGIMTEWTESKDPVEIVDLLGDVYARCGWFVVSSIEMDPVTHRAHLRLKRTLETYGVEGGGDLPACDFLRGYFAGFFRSLFWIDDIDCTETRCRGKGDRECEFFISRTTTG